MYFVLPYYKMSGPERLQEFMDWNSGVLELEDTVIAVVDKPQAVTHGHLKQIVYPVDLPIFSLSKTCNYGIRRALEVSWPGTVIIKTDADIMFPFETLMEMRTVKEGQAYSPPYHMVNSVADRHSYTCHRLVADLAIGTVAMVGADWDKTCGYNENLVGYGCDDGDMWHRIGLAGIKRWRGLGCYHIAHRANTPQKEKHCIKSGDNRRYVRTDHHGRNNGINPNRMRENTEIIRKGVWADKDWGKCKPTS